MSADLINLRQARKARARKTKQDLAVENRAKFGRSKLEREQASTVDDLARVRHAGHKLDTAADPDEPTR